MARHALTDKEWNRLQEAIPRLRGAKSKLGDRAFVDAVLYRAKTGIPWRDLPERFGPWKTVFNRFDRWSNAGRWEAIFKTLQVDVDDTYNIADGSIVRAHQDACGGKGGLNTMLWDVLEGAYQAKSTRS